MVPLVGWMIGLYGWRTAAVISGCVLLAVGLPLACIIKKIYSQEEAALLTGEHSGANLRDSPPASTDPQFTLKQALHHRSFWLLSVAMGMRHLVTEGVSVHFVILLVDRGWSTEAASTLLGISALIGAPARIGMGWLGDLLDKRRMVMGLLLALSVSVLMMGYTAQAVVFTTCMIIYSLAYGGLAALQEPIRADYFGTRAFATIQGMSRSVVTAGTFLGPIIAGFFYDVTKSYTIAFGVFAVVSLAATLFMFFAKPPQRVCGN
jgi:cyanate permease